MEQVSLIFLQMAQHINHLRAIKVSAYEVRDLDRSNKGKKSRDHSHMFIPLLCFQNTLHFCHDTWSVKVIA